jgi:hypothetical protein
MRTRAAALSLAGSVRRINPQFYMPYLRDAFALVLMPVLAQEVPPPDAVHLSAWLVDAAALAGMLLVFLKVIDHFKRRPSLEQELEKLLRQLRAELNQLRHEQAEHIATVRARVEGAHQRVDLLTHDLNNKLQRLPGEIVDLLHKTGVITR